MKRKSKGGRPACAVTTSEQLGTIGAVAAYMKVGRTWLSGVKRRADELAPQMAKEKISSPFAGGKTCAAWIREFIRLPINAGFKPTAGYKKGPQ